MPGMHRVVLSDGTERLVRVRKAVLDVMLRGAHRGRVGVLCLDTGRWEWLDLREVDHVEAVV
jgi:16S rRNA U516 pseudouridylate synthase RsuA-like enzyme